jgi:hypothetical protein
MSNLEQIDWMLNAYYKAQDQQNMREDSPEAKGMTVHINSRNKGISYILYNLDIEGRALFPFFNLEHNAPRYLLGMCDYAIFAEYNDRFYVLLIEMKLGSNAPDAKKQLDAGETFIDFLIKSAKRIGLSIETSKIYKVYISARRERSGQQKNPFELTKDGYVRYLWPDLNLNKLLQPSLTANG